MNPQRRSYHPCYDWVEAALNSAGTEILYSGSSANGSLNQDVIPSMRNARSSGSACSFSSHSANYMSSEVLNSTDSSEG